MNVGMRILTFWLKKEKIFQTKNLMIMIIER